MFSCVYDGQDHTQCCQSNQVPEICHGICAGNITSVDYRHFRCLDYIPQILNCHLRKYDVLPSEPRNFRFSNIGTSMGLLHWDVPLKHGDSVTGYLVHYRAVSPVTGDDIVKVTNRNNFVLEDLEPETSYEVSTVSLRNNETCYIRFLMTSV